MSSRRRKGKRPAPGSSPSELTVDPCARPSELRVISYGPADFREVDKASRDLADAAADGRPVVWLDVEGLGDLPLLRRIAEKFQMHRLALEDVVQVHQRPRSEEYGDHLFIVMRLPTMEGGAVGTEQVTFFLGKSFLITFQDGRPGDCFEGVRNRIRKGIGRIRSSGPDYLAYTLIDAIVDAFFPALEEIGERLDSLESEVLSNPAPDVMTRLRGLRRDLLTLRRAAWPLREAVHTLVRDHLDRFPAETLLHLRDVYGHAVEVVDLLETYRDLAGSLVDVYLSSVNNRLSEVMRVLTIVSTIFIPLSFIAGVYGMNFKRMPELEWEYGYPLALALMAITGFGLFGWFWWNGWIGRSHRRPKADES